MKLVLEIETATNGSVTNYVAVAKDTGACYRGQVTSTSTEDVDDKILAGILKTMRTERELECLKD